MKKIYKNKQTFGKKPWVALLLVMALSFGACLETKKNEDDTSTILGFLFLNQQSPAAPAPTTCSETSAGCRIFLTAAIFNGNLGGVAGADEKCNADSNKPTGNLSYKALIVDATNRTITITGANTASPEVSNVKDWPLKANTKYFQKSGAEFATTTAGGIFLDGSVAMRAPVALEGMEWAVSFAHTGMTSMNPVAATIEVAGSGLTCSNWTSADNGVNSRVAHLISNTAPRPTNLASFSQYSCDQRQHLVCVEQ